MTDIELMIGQSSTEAERKRAARLENKALLPPRTKGGHLSDIRPPEIEIEIELEKEIEIEKEREGETGHPHPRRLWQIQQCDTDRYRAFRAENRAARQVGVLY